MDLLTADRRLQDAQRAGDVEALDGLLHARVVGAGPDGTVFGKEDDLEGHRSGALRITRLVEESIDVQDDGLTGMTRVVAAVDAVQDGTQVSARLLYTRLWVRHDGSWQVLAATLAPLPPSPLRREPTTTAGEARAPRLERTDRSSRA